MFAAIIMRGSRAGPSDFASGEDLIAALTPFRKADVEGVWRDERALIAQATRHNTPESLHERAPELCAETDRVIASWVRLDNREELCAALRLEDEQRLTDPQIILAAHRKWGSNCARHLEGDFSFVIYDPKRREAYCARDSIGAKPLFYMLTDEVFIAATSVAAIRTMRGLTLAPNFDWIVLGLSHLFYDPVQSAYEGVVKLAPAHDIMIVPEGICDPHEFFRFDLDAAHADRRDQRWVELYRDALERSVRVRARSQFLVGSESSAGLDSSSIVATVPKFLPHSRGDFHCFGVLSFEDEVELLLETAAMHEIRHTHIVTKPPMLEIEEPFVRALRAIGHPPEHGQILHVSSTFCDLAERLGIRTLLSGYGGDEVVTSPAQHLAAELFKDGSYLASFRELPGSPPMRLARLGKLAVKGPVDPNALARTIFRRQLALSCVKEEVLRECDIERRISEQWAGDARHLSVSEIAANGPVFRLSRPGRLESEAIFAATYGMEYRYPLLDRRLLAQYLVTPAIEKRKQGLGRYLHRRAMADRMPQTIVWRKSKSMGGHIGGAMNTETPPRVVFGDLPPDLQSIIDGNALENAQNSLIEETDNTSESAIRGQMMLSQVRQFSYWLQNS